MMMKASLVAALFGFSSAKVEMDYGNGGGSDLDRKNEFCCTANEAMSNAYSVCEDVMNKYSSAQEQEMQCASHGSLCKYVACENVGYCVDPSDFDYFDEIMAWENSENQRKLLVDVEQYADWGASKPPPTPRPTSLGGWGVPKTTKPPKTPRPTSPPKTPRPTNPPKTPKPTVWRAPKTPRPTNPPKTPKPTRPMKTKTPRPTNPPKTSKPTVWRAPKTPRPTNPPKTPKPTRPMKTKTPRPTNPPK